MDRPLDGRASAATTPMPSTHPGETQFVVLPAEIPHQLAAGEDLGLIITANDRLRRQWRLALEAEQARRNVMAPSESNSVWFTPTVASIEVQLDSWYQQLWRSSVERLPEPVGSVALRLLARDLQPDADQFAAESQKASLLEWILEAWQMLQRFQVSESLEPGFDPTQAYAEPLSQGQRYAAIWLRRIRQALTEQEWITSAELPARLSLLIRSALDESKPTTLSALRLPNKIQLVGFEQIQPALMQLFTTLQDAGCELVRLPLDPTPTSVHDAPDTSNATVYAAPSPAAEFAAVAGWCRSLLAHEDSDATQKLRIGIVHPRLIEVRAELERSLAAELQPLRSSAQADLFSVAAGRSLGKEPVTVQALAFIRWCFRPQTADQVVQLMSSPYLASLPLQELPSTLTRAFTLEQFSVQAAPHVAPVFTQLAMFLRKLPEQAAMNTWQQVFAHLLNTVGWGTANLGTVAFQGLRQTKNLLQTPVPIDSAMTPLEALQLLQELLTAELFAPMSQDTPIIALGSLETTGLSFTHLWVMGMQDSAWPGTVSPNPLVPLSLQQQLQIPRIDSTSELAFASARIEHWHRCAKTLVFSYPAQDREAEAEASPLLRNEPTTTQPGSELAEVDSAETDSATAPYLFGHPLSAAAIRATLTEVNDSVLALPAPETPVDSETVALRGGTGLLKDQALCPFRAYAAHRLEFRRSQTPHSYPNPIEQGVLMHTALERYCNQYLEELAQRSANRDQLAAIANEAVAKELARFPAAYRRLEALRLTTVLTAFQDFEVQRLEAHDSGPLTVRSEEATTFDLGQNRYRLQVDRIDQYAGGSSVIDYKSNAPTINRLMDDRLTEPQLAIYALVVEDSASIAFYEVATSGIKAKVMGNLDTGLGNKKKTDLLSAAEFDAQKKRWSEQLQELNDEYSTGVATVTPTTAACNYCELGDLCRIKHLGLRQDEWLNHNPDDEDENGYDDWGMDL